MINNQITIASINRHAKSAAIGAKWRHRSREIRGNALKRIINGYAAAINRAVNEMKLLGGNFAVKSNKSC